MSRKKISYIHLFTWLFAIFVNLPYSGIRDGMQTAQFVTYLFAFLYLMLVFYLFYLYIAPGFLNRRNMKGFFLVSFGVVLVMPFFGYMFLFLLRALFAGTFHGFFKGYSPAMHMSGFYPVLTAAVFGSFLRIIINWFDDMNKKGEQEKQRLAIELDLLKSKLNPHFLFNTLNNIDALIRKDPEAASSALISLSDIMRYLTYETSAGKVSLQKETEYIRNFIELFRIRVKSPDDIIFETRGDLSVEIAPALFLPLLENAFKFVSFGKSKPAVELAVSSASGKVEFWITNYVEESSSDTGKGPSGFGLSNLRKRLELSYPGKYRLITENKDHFFKAELIIDTHAD
jgi:two-component system, LytTR family, sensor kinase